MTGRGPGKFPLAVSCSWQNIVNALILPEMKAALPFALTRIALLILVISVDCNRSAVGSVGSGMMISGLRVSFLAMEDRDDWRMLRLRLAASDAGAERASMSGWDAKRRST